MNKRNRNASVAVPGAGLLYLVDPASVGAASAAGIRQQRVAVGAAAVELLPFGVGVLVLD